MKGNKHKDQEVNYIEKYSQEFIQYYNKNIPDGFPHVSAKTLEAFRLTHPSLFSKDNKWTIDKHRKKLMDWLVSHHED